MLPTRSLAPLALVLAATLPAAARPSIEFLPPGYALTSLSTGGAAGAGNVIGDFSYETFRWTPSGGPVHLGGATAPVLGIGSGTPDISYDGSRISASIVSSDLHMTQGIWDESTGWSETMPPAPANGVLLDDSYGSAWGLSGDGQTLTGFFWGMVDGFTKARACAWTSGGGMLSMEQISDRSARVNAANRDGSVTVGWEERADGVWRPTAWRNGVRYILQDSLAFCDAYAVSSDGSIVVGQGYIEATSQRNPAIWTWNGAAYDMQVLTSLPGTNPVFGQAYLSGVSGDGSLAVGGNQYLQNPGGPRDGIVWTPSGGVVKDVDFIASLGLTAQIPLGMDIRDFIAVSPDGSAITGLGYFSATGQYQSFVIRLAPPPCIGDADGDRDIDFADVTSVLTNFGHAGAPFAPGDADGSAIVNFADVTVVLTNFGAACP